MPLSSALEAVTVLSLSSPQLLDMLWTWFRKSCQHVKPWPEWSLLDLAYTWLDLCNTLFWL